MKNKCRYGNEKKMQLRLETKGATQARDKGLESFFLKTKGLAMFSPEIVILEFGPQKPYKNYPKCRLTSEMMTSL